MYDTEHFINSVWRKIMDRRQKKTREAIFNAFITLLSKKEFGEITVGEIINLADVGRATFYSHFETKDFLLKELCDDLFCHIFDAENDNVYDHHHLFNCDGCDSVILHLFQHFEKNDNNILALLSSQNNELFLKYFQNNFKNLIEGYLFLFESQKSKDIPDSFWENHILSTFINTVKWWVDNGRKESAELITKYFFSVI